MSGQPENFPQPGHAGDLHEWAKQKDAENRRAATDRLGLAEQAARNLIFNQLGDRATEEFKEQFEAALVELRTASYCIGILETGPGWSTVFDGQAMNA